MNDEDIARITAEYAKTYPALIDFRQACEIAHCPLDTVYDWSSRGLFREFKSKPGRRALLDRNAFVRFIVTCDTSDDLDIRNVPAGGGPK